jgi:hypothetical protein
MLLKDSLRYRDLLKETHQSALVQIASFIDAPLTDLTLIDGTALRAWREIWVPTMPEGEEWSDWDWEVEMNNWKGEMARFELAIWSDDQLCGLAVGKPSRRRQCLGIHGLQGSPVEYHPLKSKIMLIVIEAAEKYAAALGCLELRFMNPLAGMVSQYEKHGFLLAKESKSVAYCYRQL